jgi:hypothetical protein
VGGAGSENKLKVEREKKSKKQFATSSPGRVVMAMTPSAV